MAGARTLQPRRAVACATVTRIPTPPSSTPSGAPVRTWMRVQFFLFFLTWTTFVSYWAPIFSSRGFDSGRIGVSITVSLVARALAVAILFPLVNR